MMTRMATKMITMTASYNFVLATAWLFLGQKKNSRDSYREDVFDSGPTDDDDDDASAGCLRRSPSFDKTPSGTFYKHNHITMNTHSW